jgi:hypothetical protein
VGKSSPPPAPDYTPEIMASQQASASDAQAAQINAGVAEQQLAQQNIYAGRAADLGDKYAQMASDQAAFGKQQYEDVLPYLQSYMQSQLDYTGAAQQNQEQQAAAAALSNQQAQDTYNRYQSVYAPKEDQFANEAFNWASPARIAQTSAAAEGDVATSFQAQKDSATRQLASYGIDPSQGSFQRAMSALDISKAAASAAAGTMTAQQTAAQGKQYELAALQVGQKLPAQAIGQAGLGLQQTASGLGGASIGGGGIQAAGNFLTAGTNAMGSPTSYAALNPYTNLTSAYGTEGVGLYGTQASNLGNVSSAIGAGTGALNSMYSSQMANFQANQAQSPWAALGSILGAGAKLGSAAIGAGLFG